MSETYGVSFERKQISEMLQDFHLLTGIPVAFVMHDQRYAIFVSNYTNPFCLRLRADPNADLACQNCDREAFNMARATGTLYLYRCHAGLTEAIAPIFAGQRLLGFLMMGKTTSTMPSSESWQDIWHLCNKYHVNMQKLKEDYFSLVPFPAQNMKASARLLTRLACAILTSGWVKSHEMPILEKLNAQIQLNLSEPLCTSFLSSLLGISASHLQHVVKEQTGKTVTEHVRSLRLQQACHMLQETNLPIQEIASRFGFDDARYFTRLFRQFTGMSPSQYRIGAIRNAESST